MTQLALAIKEYFEDQEWNFNYNEERDVFRMRMNLNTVDSCAVYVQMRDRTAFTVYSVFPIKVAEGKRAAAAEFLTRANYGLIHGNFEFDFSDGEVRFKVTTLCGDIALDKTSLNRIMNVGFCMLDRYGDGLLSVIYGGAAPADAIAAIENRPADAQ